jgi:hypothetical protein
MSESVTDQRVSAAIRLVLAEMTKRYEMQPRRSTAESESFWANEWLMEDQLIMKLAKRPITIGEIKVACAQFMKKVFA